MWARARALGFVRSGIVLGELGDAPVQCVFYFFRDVSCETTGFGTILGQAPSRNGSKTYGLAWDVMKKVEKNVRR